MGHVEAIIAASPVVDIYKKVRDRTVKTDAAQTISCVSLGLVIEALEFLRGFLESIIPRKCPVFNRPST